MSFNSSGLNANNVLTGFAIRYALDRNDLIADKVFKPMPVTEDTGRYTTFGRDNLRAEDDSMGPKGIAKEVTSTANLDGTFNIKDYGLKEFLAEKQLRLTPKGNRQMVINQVVQGVMDRVLIQKEKRAAAALFNGTTFSGFTAALAAGDRFNNPASDPYEIIQSYVDSVTLYTPTRNLKLIMGHAVYSAMRSNANLIARTRNDALRILDKKTLLSLFEDMGVDDILVGSASENTSDEGQTTQTNARIWGKGLVIGYIPNVQSTVDASLTLAKQFVSDEKALYKQFVFKDTPEANGNYYKTEASYDLKVVAVPAGYYLSTVVD